MNTKAFFPCGGGSNLILGTGRKNRIIFNTCIIFEKKLEWKNFYQKKNLFKKKTCWVNNFCQKKFCKKNFCWKNIFQKKNLLGKQFL